MTVAALSLASIGCLAVSQAGAATTHIAATATRHSIPFRDSTRIVGRVTGHPGGNGAIALDLQADPYPYGDFTTTASATTAADGSYRFRVTPARNTRYRVILRSAPSDRSAQVPVTVNELVSAHVRYETPGRARVVIRSRHPADLGWGGKRLRWYLSRGTASRLRLTKTAHTRTPRPGLTQMKTTLQVPAGRFRVAACFNARSLAAMGPPGARPGCGRHRFEGGAHALYQASGKAPFGYPNRASIDRARRYLAGRAGVKSFAVVTSEGRIYGSHLHRTFVSASVVKAMLLVAYLHKLHHEHRGLDSASRSTLHSMIHVSDNTAATRIWSIVGDGRLRRLAHRAGMKDFSIEGIWANAMISAGDQARFFHEMNRLLPNEFRHFADHLLSHITSSQSWGIPAVARPRGWRVFFKGGWRGTGRGQLVHQVARLRRPHEEIAMAVLTDGDPSMTYGIQTIEDTAGRLLSRQP
jgi:hypothetical protein